MSSGRTFLTATHDERPSFRKGGLGRRLIRIAGLDRPDGFGTGVTDDGLWNFIAAQ